MATSNTTNNETLLPQQQNDKNQINNLAADENEEKEYINSTVIFIVTAATIIFAFGAILFLPHKNNLWLGLKTAIAIMLLGLGIIFIFKVRDETIKTDWRAMFFTSAVWISSGVILKNPGLLVIGLFLLVISLVMHSKWQEGEAWSELPPARKKIKIVMISTIGLTFVIGISFFFLEEKANSIKAKMHIAQTMNAMTLTRQYNNRDYRFNFTYPTEYLLNDNFQYQFMTNNILARIDLPDSFYQGTNLGEAVFMVGASQQPSIIASCTVPVLGEEKQGSRTINGIDFTVFYSLEPAAGNRYETTSWRTVTNNTCYEAIEFLHWGEISNYTPGAVKEFNHTAVARKLNEILSSLKLF